LLATQTSRVYQSRLISRRHTVAVPIIVGAGINRGDVRMRSIGNATPLTPMVNSLSRFSPFSFSLFPLLEKFHACMNLIIASDRPGKVCSR